MKIIFFIAVVGTILFFPLNIGGSTCLFGYLTGLQFSFAEDAATTMLNHYMRCFALPWWISIGFAIWSYKKTIYRNKKDHSNGGIFNA